MNTIVLMVGVALALVSPAVADDTAALQARIDAAAALSSLPGLPSWRVWSSRAT